MTDPTPACFRVENCSAADAFGLTWLAKSRGRVIGLRFLRQVFERFSFRPMFFPTAHIRFAELFGVKMSVRRVLVSETANRQPFQAPILGLQRWSPRTEKTYLWSL
jgi:hypothetical protein